MLLLLYCDRTLLGYKEVVVPAGGLAEGRDPTSTEHPGVGYDRLSRVARRWALPTSAAALPPPPPPLLPPGLQLFSPP